MLNYIGNGAFIRGVPASNLTDAEADRFGRDSLVRSGLYEESIVAEKPRKKKIKESAKRADIDSAEVKENEWN